ncbi:MAG: PadR family transcriptional regulator [Holophagales bacterium]|nr:PadR family transcriptional regulator [Holophagales bacterium]
MKTSGSEISSRLPLQPRDFLILLALAEGERHGYGLIQDLEQLSDGQVRIDPANLYRSLRRLARDGLVTDLGRRSAAVGDERRRYYAITGSGGRLAAAEAERLDRLTAIARDRLLISRPEGSR